MGPQIGNPKNVTSIEWEYKSPGKHVPAIFLGFPICHHSRFNGKLRSGRHSWPSGVQIPKYEVSAQTNGHDS